MNPRRLLLPLSIAATSLACGASPALASSPPSKQQSLTVSVNIKQFTAAKTRTTAQGTASAILMDSNGHSTTFKQPVSLAVKSGGSCKILSLVLDQLKLNLLGLNVSLDKVNLQVTGKRTGVLGVLFCKLANTKVKRVARVTAARKLTAQVRRHGLRPIQFTVPVKPVTAAQASGGAATCQVLNLILGPLNLDLLGLVVDLNKVNLNITASRGQGQLGDIFCQLADDNTSGAPAQ